MYIYSNINKDNAYSNKNTLKLIWLHCMDILTGYIGDYICVDAHKVFPSYHSQLVSSYYSLSAVGVYLEQIQIHHSKTDTAIPIFGLQSFMELFSCIAGLFWRI